MANQYDTNLKLQAIADAIGDSQSSGLISALEDIADAVAGGGGSSAGLVSDNFSETDTYDLGDYCIHNNTLYVCINAITTPGPWDLSDWQATNAGIQLSSLNSALGVLLWSNNAPSSAMAAGDINLSSSDYDYLKVFYESTKDDVRFIHSEDVLKGKSCSLVDFYFSGGGITPVMRARDFSYSTATKYTVSGGSISVQGSGSTANTGVCIPIAIYGCKFA